MPDNHGSQRDTSAGGQTHLAGVERLDSQLPPGSPVVTATGPTVPPKPAPKPTVRPGMRDDSIRDTAESIVIAFVLAFLFRAFEAEAFVIPTGSMAPTLYGAHKDITCAKCGFHYVVGASDDIAGPGQINTHARVHSAVCPNCRYSQKILYDEIFKGDRILVNKFPYEVGTPDRWDVVVFKYPEEAKTNYIKRLVGLPGEELKIDLGDIYVRKTEQVPWRMPRKPFEKHLKLLQIVHDDRHPARELLDAGFPERWQPEGGTAWSHDAAGRAFRIDRTPANADSWSRLAYQHLAASAADWNRAVHPELGRPGLPEPELITDFYGYNGRILNSDVAFRGGEDLPELPHSGFNGSAHGLYWVGDLSLSANVQVIDPQGKVRFELNEGRRRYFAEIDLATGQGALSYSDPLLQPKAGETLPLGEPFPTTILGAGMHDVRFVNLDDRVALLVDGQPAKVVELEPGSKYPPLWEGGSPGPAQGDLIPAAIATLGASVRVSELVLERDVYYRSASPQSSAEEYDPPNDLIEFRRLLARPEEWWRRYSQSRKVAMFRLNDNADDAEDEFFVLGDNSPRSKDSRFWEHSSAVPRRLLIGKAFYIYWPHGVPFGGPEGKGWPVGHYEEPRGPNVENSGVPSWSLPFYPQVQRMKRIR
jgi:signal peptidase I